MRGINRSHDLALLAAFDGELLEYVGGGAVLHASI